MTLTSLRKMGVSPWQIGRTKGGLNSKLHAVCDVHGRPVRLPLTAGNVQWHRRCTIPTGRPVRLLLTAGNVNDIVGAGELLKDLPAANYLPADKGYDANQSTKNGSFAVADWTYQRRAKQQVACRLRRPWAASKVAPDSRECPMASKVHDTYWTAGETTSNGGERQ